MLHGREPVALHGARTVSRVISEGKRPKTVGEPFTQQIVGHPNGGESIKPDMVIDWIAYGQAQTLKNHDLRNKIDQRKRTDDSKRIQRRSH